MNIIFRQYQKQAVDRIYAKAQEFLKKVKEENSEDWKIIFRSPTGSGKTLMMSKIVEKIAFKHDESVSFVWLSKGQLANQSKQSFEKYLGMDCTRDDMQKIVLNNQWFFVDVIDNSVTEYAKTRKKKAREEKINKNWNIPVYEFLPKNYTEKKVEKCIVEPFYSGIYQTENGFIDHYLEQNKDIKWWYQNGEKNEIYFGLPYVDDSGKENTFYPDFIVQYIDGRIGIFDTKQGNTVESRNTELKANALSKYIENENKKDKNLFGGIVVSDNNKKFKLNENVKHNYTYLSDEWLIL